MDDFELEAIYGFSPPTDAELEAARLAAEGDICPVCGYPPDSFKHGKLLAQSKGGHAVSEETAEPVLLPLMKAVKAENQAKAQDKTLSQMSRDELIAEAKKRGVDVAGLKNNQAIRVALGMRGRK